MSSGKYTEICHYISLEFYDQRILYPFSSCAGALSFSFRKEIPPEEFLEFLDSVVRAVLAVDDIARHADPPYLLATRSGKQYRHEMTDADHEALLAALKAHPGPVILSGYHSPMYDSELSGWNIIERKAYNQNGDRRTEVLWCNYEIPTLIG